MTKERNARTYEHAGRTLTIRQWAAEIGLRPQTLRNRLGAGWSLDRALRLNVEIEAEAPQWTINGIKSHAPEHPFECTCEACEAEVVAIEHFVAACEAEQRLIRSPEAIEARAVRRLTSQMNLAGLAVANG